ncbi:hypothetical protein [Lacinutrix chionoecetis]
MKFSTILLSFLLLFHTYSPSQNVDASIRSEFLKLKTISLPNFSTELKIVEKGVMKSKPNGEVIFSKEQLNKLSSRFSATGVKYLIRILLAHELAHQFQFNWYKGKKELNDKPISRMLLEGQADMLAGFCLGSLFIKETNFNQLETSNIDIEDFYSIFQFMLSIGIDEGTLGTHPSKIDRLLLIKQGLEAGIINSGIELAKLNEDRIINYYGSLDAYNEIINESFKTLDYDINKENIFNWTYKITKKIINYNPEIAKNIVLIKDNNNSTVNWNTKQEYPFVDYNLSYLNISKKPIDINMEVYVSHVSRLKKDSIKYHSKVNVNIHKFRIEPRETKVLQGRLRWNRAENDELGMTELTEDKMPRIVFPDAYSQASIASYSFADAEENSNLSKQKINFLALETSKSGSIYKLAANIKKIIRDFKIDKNNLFLGIGNLYTDQIGKSFIIYKSPATFDKKTTIEIYRTLFNDALFDVEENYATEIKISYNSFFNKKEATAKLDYVINALDLALPDYTKSIEDKENYKYISYNSQDVTVEVLFERYYRDTLKNYVWEIEIDIYD